MKCLVIGGDSKLSKKYDFKWKDSRNISIEHVNIEETEIQIENKIENGISLIPFL